MTEVKIKFDKHSYAVVYIDHKGREYDIGYGDTGSSMEMHAQNFYELGQALQVKIELERG